MDTIVSYRELLGQALLTTTQLTVYGIVLAIAFAFLFGLMRVSQFAIVRGVSYVIVELLRGTALLVQLFWFFYVLPFLGVELHPILTGVLVLGLNEGAYAAEVVRSAILSRPKGQTEASVALGLSHTQRLWRVILPQSIPVMLPGFGNVFVDLMKATALVSLVTIQDLTYVANNIRRSTGETLTLFGLLLVLYFILSLLLTGMSRWLERSFSLERPVSNRRRAMVVRGEVSNVG